MDIEQARFNMVEQQIRPWDVLDQDILDLLFVVRREIFVPAPLRDLAFVDAAIPLGDGAAMLEPKIEARVLQDLALKGNEHVLEVGCRSGYFTGLLASTVAKVTSVEIDPALAKFATENLARAGIKNATIVSGDGARGWKAAAPYDVIVFTGSMEVLPEEVFAQLKPDGKVFAVIGKLPVMNATLTTVTASGGRSSRTLFETVLPPLTNAATSTAFVF